jgi:hypothetical protein
VTYDPSPRRGWHWSLRIPPFVIGLICFFGVIGVVLAILILCGVLP